MSYRTSSLLRTVPLGVALLAFWGAGLSFGAAPAKLFPTNLPSKSWVTFSATGFSKPACGVIYRTKDEVSCGMPLGGIDAGCIDLETSGLLGYNTIYNTHIPRGGPSICPSWGSP
jgi:hypothetical protein